MEKENYQNWHQLIYYVSDIYKVTKKFRFGERGKLGSRIRRTAVNISASVNSVHPSQNEYYKYTDIYPILSAVSVLETYLLIAKENKLLSDTSVLDNKLDEVKEILYAYLEDKEEE